ncbi:methyl-accepting chemotaxis protein [Thalassobaculum sp.]|uniref:methyl-accepting chemotaxis protein n=1 Tax=Thalassobaculum sp. TaxID=2022740 RepID=UPI0032ECB0A5
MLDDLACNAMICEIRDFRITYANRATIETLTRIENVLPVKAKDLVGTSIDVFHKNPAHQRKLLANPANLPHKARIEIGGEVMDLNISAIRDGKGRYVAALLQWALMTEQLRKERYNEQLLNMIDEMPINVMMADPKTAEIIYANRTTVETLKTIQHLIPVRAEDIVGTNIDVFHKNPAHQRKLIGDPSHLPHDARIQLGDETLSLKVAAIRDRLGKYVGAMVNWSVITQQVKLAETFENTVKSVVDGISAAATQMHGTSESLSATAEEASSQANVVASAAEELAASIGEIAHQVTASASQSSDAVREAHESSIKIEALSQAAERIGAVVQLIEDVASQTNLLALNATIEAARAGDAGKGFAVVASEVKGLAGQTAKATQEISQQIDEVQSATRDAVASIKRITSMIENLSAIATSVSSAVEEQSAATSEVTENIAGVSGASQETGKAANEMLGASSQLSRDSETLSGEVDRFLTMVRSL